MLEGQFEALRSYQRVRSGVNVNAILRARVVRYYENHADAPFNQRLTLDVQVGGTGRLILFACPCTRHLPLTSTRAFVSPCSSCSQPMADLMSDLWHGFNTEKEETTCKVSLRASSQQSATDWAVACVQF